MAELIRLDQNARAILDRTKEIMKNDGIKSPSYSDAVRVLAAIGRISDI